MGSSPCRCVMAHHSLVSSLRLPALTRRAFLFPRAGPGRLRTRVMEIAMDTTQPKTQSERQREIDDALAANSRRIELDHYLAEKREAREHLEVWELDG